MSAKPARNPTSGEITMNESVCTHFDPHVIPWVPALRHRRAGVAADERVRRAARDAVSPGDDVPADRAEQAAEDHVRIDDALLDHPAADRLGDGDAAGEQRGEVEGRGPEHRRERAQHARAHDRGDGVRRIVEAVAEVEDEGDRDDRDDVPDHGVRRS